MTAVNNSKYNIYRKCTVINEFNESESQIIRLHVVASSIKTIVSTDT